MEKNYRYLLNKDLQDIEKIKFLKNYFRRAYERPDINPVGSGVLDQTIDLVMETPEFQKNTTNYLISKGFGPGQIKSILDNIRANGQRNAIMELINIINGDSNSLDINDFIEDNEIKKGNLINNITSEYSFLNKDFINDIIALKTSSQRSVGAGEIAFVLFCRDVLFNKNRESDLISGQSTTEVKCGTAKIWGDKTGKYNPCCYNSSIFIKSWGGYFALKNKSTDMSLQNLLKNVPTKGKLKGDKLYELSSGAGPEALAKGLIYCYPVLFYGDLQADLDPVIRDQINEQIKKYSHVYTDEESIGIQLALLAISFVLYRYHMSFRNIILLSGGGETKDRAAYNFISISNYTPEVIFDFLFNTESSLKKIVDMDPSDSNKIIPKININSFLNYKGS